MDGGCRRRRRGRGRRERGRGGAGRGGHCGTRQEEQREMRRRGRRGVAGGQGRSCGCEAVGHWRCHALDLWVGAGGFGGARGRRRRRATTMTGRAGLEPRRRPRPRSTHSLGCGVRSACSFACLHSPTAWAQGGGRSHGRSGAAGTGERADVEDELRRTANDCQRRSMRTGLAPEVGFPRTLSTSLRFTAVRHRQLSSNSRSNASVMPARREKWRPVESRSATDLLRCPEGRRPRSQPHNWFVTTVAGVASGLVGTGGAWKEERCSLWLLLFKHPLPQTHTNTHTSTHERR